MKDTGKKQRGLSLMHSIYKFKCIRIGKYLHSCTCICFNTSSEPYFDISWLRKDVFLLSDLFLLFGFVLETLIPLQFDQSNRII